MSNQWDTLGPARVSNDEVWRETKLIFATSLLIFLVTITLGFLNVFTSGALPRWQLLVHLHSATLGWLTLSAFGATVWLFTAERAVSDAYANRVRWLARVLIGTFIGLIASFGIAFSQGGDTVYRLAAFGPLAALAILVTAAFFLQQLRRLPVVTTAHLLTAAGFFVLGVAVTFATVMALGRAGVVGVPSFASEGHVFGILAFQLLVTTGIIEWLVVRDRGRWTLAGALQGGLGVLLGLLVPIFVIPLVAGVPRGPLGVVLLLGIMATNVLFALVFLARVGVSALRATPLTADVEAWVFFATLWFVVVAFSFPLRIVFDDAAWWMVFNAHAAMVGIVTNLLFGVIAARTSRSDAGDSLVQTAAMWVINAGVVVFVGVFIVSGSRHGAVLMGFGLILGVGWGLASIRETRSDPNPSAPADVETTD